MNKSFIINQEEELSDLAKDLLSFSGKKRIFTFQGKLGSGKTTFIKQLCIQLNVSDNVNSPTFPIINEYLRINGESVYHFDFYRIKNLEEAFDLGCEEYFDNRSYCFVEWPDKAFGLIPEDTIQVNILQRNSQRIFNIAV